MKKRYFSKDFIDYLLLFIFIAFIFIFLIFIGGKSTGFATFTSGPGEGQTTLKLQEADIDNLGDAYVDGSLANRNYGVDIDLKSQRNPYQRIYLKFNISLIPSTQIIDNSKLCLYLYNDQGEQTISVNHVYVSNWNEGTEDNVDVDGQDYTTNITWNNQPCGVDLDNFTACNLTAEDFLYNDGTSDDSWQCWNVTNIVSLEYNSSNEVVSFVISTEDFGNPDLFYSKEYTTESSLIPYLNVTYYAANIAPVINLIEPQNLLYTENESLALNYTVYDNDENIDFCWYNIDNGENITLINCENSTFNISEGNHNLTIYANDSLGLISSDFVEFNVDASGISLSILEPIGIKTSRTAIPITYSVIGTNVSCWYNVKTSVGGVIIGNTSLQNCGSSNFDVSTDGDYILYLYANNTLGSFDFEFSPFSVDTSTVIVNSGGGGGSRTTIIEGFTELELGNLSNLVVYSGDNKRLSLKAKNIGTSILNDCYIVEKGNSNFWILSNEIKNLASGEIYDFVFDLIISEIAEIGDYELEVVLQCQEINKSKNLIFEVIERKLNFEILNVERLTEEEVRVEYFLEELSNINQKVEIQFLLFDFEGKKIAEIRDVKDIPANSKSNSEILIPIEASLEGEIRLLVNLNSETYSTFVSEDIILGAPISGLSIFGNSGEIDKIASIFIILLFLVGAFFIIRRILRHKKKINHKKKRLKNRKKKFDFKPFS